MHAKKTAFIVEHDFIMATYLADRVIVFDGKPGIDAHANKPESLLTGCNTFLKNLDVTFRRDPTNFRPRINKLNSQLDQEQKLSGNYVRVNSTPALPYDLLTRHSSSWKRVPTRRRSGLEKPSVAKGNYKQHNRRPPPPFQRDKHTHHHDNHCHHHDDASSSYSGSSGVLGVQKGCSGRSHGARGGRGGASEMLEGDGSEDDDPDILWE